MRHHPFNQFLALLLRRGNYLVQSSAIISRTSSYSSAFASALSLATSSASLSSPVRYIHQIITFISNAIGVVTVSVLIFINITVRWINQQVVCLYRKTLHGLIDLQYPVNAVVVGFGHKFFMTNQAKWDLQLLESFEFCMLEQLSLRVQDQEAKERYGRQLHARLAPRRSYAQACSISVVTLYCANLHGKRTAARREVYTLLQACQLRITGSHADSPAGRALPVLTHILSFLRNLDISEGIEEG
ncbi:hypothetical protein PR048_021919 [Dryococelus australis]|uniref:Uncharacterized protein n=1 Tax=Dryococelus australis TaxID=614101 RepID=A0ABQ9GZL0_9NEOP|nr:hypothetical protein PR048_021919 [Dryococelus australis]